jgi:hypothetical protein
VAREHPVCPYQCPHTFYNLNACDITDMWKKRRLRKFSNCSSWRLNYIILRHARRSPQQWCKWQASPVLVICCAYVDSLLPSGRFVDQIYLRAIGADTRPIVLQTPRKLNMPEVATFPVWFRSLQNALGCGHSRGISGIA